jgi:hypothetical protein
MQSNSRDSRAYLSELERLLEQSSRTLRALEQAHDRGGHTTRESEQLNTDIKAICAIRRVLHMARFAMSAHTHDAEPIVHVSAEVNEALFNAGIMIQHHAGFVYNEEEKAAQAA